MSLGQQQKYVYLLLPWLCFKLFLLVGFFPLKKAKTKSLNGFSRGTEGLNVVQMVDNSGGHLVSSDVHCCFR